MVDFSQVINFMPEPDFLLDILEDYLHLIHIEWLGEIVRSAQLHSSYCVFGGIVSGQHYNLSVETSLHFLKNIYAAAPWKIDVEYYYVGGRCKYLAHHIISPAIRIDFVPLILQ